jgi:hypothetical protein
MLSSLKGKACWDLLILIPWNFLLMGIKLTQGELVILGIPVHKKIYPIQL